MNDYVAARYNMVENQIRANRVNDDSILEAFKMIPREDFVPTHKKSVAYADEDLKIGQNRYLIEPMVFGRLLQIAMPVESDVVLDIGCCSGYSTAIVSRLVSSVVAVESDEEFVKVGNENLAKLEIDNAAIIHGDLAIGYAKQKPYSLILIAGAVEEVPDILLNQLGDNGRLVTILRDQLGAIGRAVIFERIKGVFSSQTVFDAATPTLYEFSKKTSFVF